MKIVVIGDMGLIGRKAICLLTDLGHHAVAASRRTGVDVVTGAGLQRVLEGADVVVDLSDAPSLEDQAAMDFFHTAGRNMAAAEWNAGVRHHVALSIVGTDGLQQGGYFRARQVQEWLVSDSDTPWTMIHATQFFESLRLIADSSTEAGVVRLPPARLQPMAAQDVAAAVAQIALTGPRNGRIEVAGPTEYWLADLISKLLDLDRDPRRIVVDAAATYMGAPVDQDALMPNPGARLSATTFEWWFAAIAPLTKRRAGSA